MPRSSFNWSIRLSTPMRMETSSIEIGSSARMISGSTARARAIATRWRCPPDSWYGYLPANSSAGLSPTDASRPRTVCPASPRLLVDADRALEVEPDGAGRVERPVGILEDHLHRAPVLQRGPARLVLEDVAAVQQDLPAGRLDEPRDQTGGRRLAAARLAHKRHHLASPDGERRVGEGVHVLLARAACPTGKRLVRWRTSRITSGREASRRRGLTGTFDRQLCHDLTASATAAGSAARCGNGMPSCAATQWPGSTSVSTGCSSDSLWVQTVQRGWNLQPLGRIDQVGRRARRCLSACASCPLSDGNELSNPWV